jgi:hypothetical protein
MSDAATDYNKRVKWRYLGGERFDRDGVLTLGGPPTRVPRNGRIIVHNRVAHTLTQIPGAHGFRAWTQLPDRACVKCNCGWSRLPHFRMRGAPAYIYDGGPLGYISGQKPKIRRVA